MLKQRKGSVFAFAISLTAVFLTMVVGTMAYFESANKQAASEKWRDVAEQAARSGLDLVMGWGESSLDRDTKLPTSWETADGNVIDPVATFFAGLTPPPPVYQRVAAAVAVANPAGARLGTDVSEFVLHKASNYLVTFKARVQQYRMSDDAPRQYRIGVTGRVRKIERSSVNLAAGMDFDVDSDERAGIVAERLLVATFGKEPFSRYAALIDIDAVKNWVPGEVIQGPVHINRGYVDPSTTGAPGLQPASADFKALRSKMLIHTTSGTGGFTAIGARNAPVFLERVSMSIMNDGAGPLADDIIAGDNADRYRSAVEINNAPGLPNPPAAAAGTLDAVFTHPDNFGAMGGITGPVIMGSPIPFPPNSRQRIPAALGLPPGVPPANVNWFRARDAANVRRAATLPDGLYVPTVEWTSTGPRRLWAANTLTYNLGANDRPSGGIYLRGNVEEMRMTVNGNISYYMFQMGYGAPRGTPTLRRVYMVRADRAARQIHLRAFPRYIAGYIGAQAVTGSPLTAAQNSDTFINPDALRLLLQAAKVGAGAAGPERYFATLPGNPQASAVEWAIDQAAGVINGADDINFLLDAVGPGQGSFPFNGIVFVDASSHDPLNLTTNHNTTVPVTDRVPITGNIYALGDHEPNNKLAPWPGAANAGLTMERVNTNAPSAGVAPASKLTIVAAGSIFIQNSIMLEDLRTNGQGMDPQSDAITLNMSRDLLGIVADRQVVIGLAAPSAARGQTGCVVHAAVAALRDPDATSAGGIDYRKGVPAYWGSFTTEGLQPLFAASAVERYQVVVRGTAAALPNSLTAADIWRPEVLAPSEKGMPGLPLYAHTSYAAIATNTNNPNKQVRGRLVMFGSVTQFKRGAVGAGNRSYDKDFRYDKRLMTIAPPVFPSSTSIGLRVTSMYAPGDQPYRTGSEQTSTTNRDLNFMGVDSSRCPATPRPI